MIDIDETLKLTQSQGQGSRSIPAGKHFWKYKNVHLYQTGATDIFTRRKCPCFYKNQVNLAEYSDVLNFRQKMRLDCSYVVLNFQVSLFFVSIKNVRCS